MLAITVDTALDVVDANDGVTSLREAIFAANILSGADTIEFAPELTAEGPTTILITQGELAIIDALTINGPGAELLTIDASGNDPTPDQELGDGSRVFSIDDGAGSAVDVVIAGLRMTGGDSAGDGGAILNRENLALSSVRLTANFAANRGGAIYSDIGVLNVAGSTIDGNRANQSGGGIWCSSLSSDSRIESSLLSSNLAVASGGGIYVEGAGLLIENSTVYRNFAGTGGKGIDINSPASTTNIVHSTIYSNLGLGIRATEMQVISNSIVGGSLNPDLIGTFEVSFSLVENVGAAIVSGSNNILGQPARVTQIADFGGPTRMLGLAASSPALNAGDPMAAAGMNGVPEFDQRGGPYTRVFGGRINIGAFERQNTGGPLTLVVATFSDELDNDFSAGDLSLREAVMLSNANSGYEDTISFSSALDGASIVLTLGQLSIADATIIDGTSRSHRVTIDASGNDPTPGVVDGRGSRVINFTGGDARNEPLRLSLNGLVLTGADTTSSGGAVFTQENLSISDSIITGNAGDNGGAISVNSLGNTSVVIERTTLAENTSSLNGGALYLSLDGGSAAISETTISGNHARQSGGGLKIRLENGASAVIDRSVISDNGADLNRFFSPYGGGAYVDANSASSFQLLNSRISGNLVDGDKTQAGGLKLDVEDAQALIADSMIDNNRVLDSSSSPSGTGGGLSLNNQHGGTIELQRVVITGNYADGAGGAHILLPGRTRFLAPSTTVRSPKTPPAPPSVES